VQNTAGLLNPCVRSVSAFFPCYNDSNTIRQLVETVSAELRQDVPEFEVIIVDDGSTDGSAEVLEEMSSSLGVRVVTHGRNLGYGSALRSGFAASRFDWVFYTDGDGQYDPSEVRQVIATASEGVDWVQGFKISRSDNLIRGVVGSLYNFTVKLLFGLRMKDVDCDFRMMRRSLLQSVGMSCATGAICLEMMWRFQRRGARFSEVAVHHYPRKYGRSQFFRFRHVSAALLDLARLYLRLRLRRAD
jgi:glycosyltransferase involved in cell wall biosynthesis